MIWKLNESIYLDVEAKLVVKLMLKTGFDSKVSVEYVAFGDDRYDDERAYHHRHGINHL